MNLYSIRSKSSRISEAPFPCENDKRVIYELTHLVNNNPNSIIGASPDDHELYRVGIFDVETGKLKAQHDRILKDLSVLVKIKKGGESVVSKTV